MLPGLLLVSAALAEPAALALLPFGTDLYIQKKPVRAVLYTLTQAVGLAAAVVGTVGTDRALVVEDEARAGRWKVVTAAGITVGGGFYLTSVVDASNLHTKDGTAWLRDWDNDRAALAFDASAGLGVKHLPGEVCLADRRE